MTVLRIDPRFKALLQGMVKEVDSEPHYWMVALIKSPIRRDRYEKIPGNFKELKAY